MRLKVSRFLLCWLLFSLKTTSADASIVAKWSFDEASGPIIDSVASIPGNLNNVERIQGISGQALHFNGKDSYVFIGAIGSDLDLKGRPYTFSWWQRWTGPTAQYQEVFAMEDGGDYSGGYAVFLQGNILNHLHNNGPDQHWAVMSVTPEIWQYFAITFDGFVRKAYLNGELIASLPTSGFLSSDSDDPLVLGAVNAPCCGGMVNFYNGDLDEFQIFDEALTQDEIKALSMNTGLRIIQQPGSMKIQVGSSIELSVDAVSSKGPVIYQWEKNGTLIIGATNSVYTTEPTRDTGVFRFRVHVQDDSGAAVTSDEAIVQVVPLLVPGLLSSWDFEEEAGTQIQDSELLYAGTLYNVERVADRTGQGRALHFNGTNSYAFIGGVGTDLELLNTGYTITWWQRWEGETGKIQQLISMDDGADFSGGYAAYISKDGQLVALHNQGSVATSLFYGSLQRDKWQHFAITYDSFTKRLYVDGTRVLETGEEKPLKSDGDDALIFGALDAPCCGGMINYFLGDLDEVKIYTRALSESEVVALGPAPEIEILRGPENWNVGVNVSATFTINAMATAGLELHYQWMLDGADIPGATNSALKVSQPLKGLYSYHVRLSAGDLELVSDPGVLNVIQNTSPNLLAHWSFDSSDGTNIVDLSGSHTISLSEARIVLGRVGEGALEVSSSSAIGQADRAGSDLELVGSPYTICWWMQLQPSSSPRTVLEVQDRSQRLGWFIDASSTSIIASHGGTIWNATTGVQMTNWNHYALVWDGLKRSLHVNGVLRSSTSTTTPIVTHGNLPLYIGNRSTLTANLHGRLDDVRIYNYALANSEIKELIVSPLPPEISINRNLTNGFTIIWQNPWTNSYRLELSERVDGDWSPASLLPTRNGVTNSVTLPLEGNSQFFRLREL